MISKETLYLWYIEEFDQIIKSTTPPNSSGILAMTVYDDGQEFIVRAEYRGELKDERLRETDQPEKDRSAAI